MLLKYCFLLKHHKTNQISSVRQGAVKIFQGGKNALSRRDKSISKTNCESDEAALTGTYRIFGKPCQLF